VSLGGWLLLEPGPACGFFGEHLRRNGTEARCEWDLMEILRQKGDLASLDKHRETHITKQDFVQIKQMGLNAVRLPFGYWVVSGPRHKDPYHGPALEYIDRALDWAEELGLQVVLDLHGCPGGESHDAPCGRRLRPKSKWNWKQWNFTESLKVLEILATRYRDRRCVTGMQVCNEPSSEVPLEKLCQYYDRAVSTIRRAGMPADRVAVILPIFQRKASEVSEAFLERSGRRHENYCWDMHYYYCFDWWNKKSYGDTLRGIETNREELNNFPACVGEWSLALGRRSHNCRCLPAKELRAIFWKAQRVAYNEASHGWFFWNWKDQASADWDWRLAYTAEEGSTACAPPPALLKIAEPAAGFETPEKKLLQRKVAHMKHTRPDDILPKQRAGPSMSNAETCWCYLGMVVNESSLTSCSRCNASAWSQKIRQAEALVMETCIGWGLVEEESPSKKRRLAYGQRPAIDISLTTSSRMRLWGKQSL